MLDVLKSVFAFAVLLYLISLLYVLPSYYRRLDKIFERLREHHAAAFSNLGEPSLSILDMNIRSTMEAVMFVVRKRYRALDDPELTGLGDAARWRLLYSISFIVVPMIGLALGAANH